MAYHEKDNQGGARSAFILEHLTSNCEALDSVPSNKGAEALLEERITISSVWNPLSSNADG